MSSEVSTQALLDSMTQTPTTHALWLNTLSFMEHIGCRKIIKSQNSERLTEMVLEHAAEEARHALFFKRLSLKVKPDFCKTYESQFLILGENCEKYFQTLDTETEKFLSNQTLESLKLSFLTYLYVTLLVEERAMDLYHTYQKVISTKKLNLNLKPLITEEEKHLEEMNLCLKKLDPDFENNRTKLSQLENQLYATLKSELIIEAERLSLQQERDEQQLTATQA